MSITFARHITRQNRPDRGFPSLVWNARPGIIFFSSLSLRLCQHLRYLSSFFPPPPVLHFLPARMPAARIGLNFMTDVFFYAHGRILRLLAFFFDPPTLDCTVFLRSALFFFASPAGTVCTLVFFNS